MPMTRLVRAAVAPFRTFTPRMKSASLPSPWSPHHSLPRFTMRLVVASLVVLEGMHPVGRITVAGKAFGLRLVLLGPAGEAVDEDDRPVPDRMPGHVGG